MKVILIGNYAPDRQESMLRFTAMLAAALAEVGWEVDILTPRVKFSRLARSYRLSGVPKWLGYVDKYILFPRELRKVRDRVQRLSGTVFHITDHSNAIYAPDLMNVPLVATCHDLLAVRGALGEDTACEASVTGKVLQQKILRGLAMVPMVACVSKFTHSDLRRLLPQKVASESVVVPNGFNYPYRTLPRAECLSRINPLAGLNPNQPFILHVGSNHPRKNRPMLLRVFSKLPPGLVHQLVLAGPPLSDDLNTLAKELGIAERVIVVEKPDNSQLEALYNLAFGLVFPSLSEGFGWPVIEAQACGCPVVCSNTTALPEIAGKGAQLISPLDSDAMAAAINRLAETSVRRTWSERAQQNALRFSTKRMVRAYSDIYARLITPFTDGREASRSLCAFQ